ncbi:alcohol acetyltransferase [Jeotgalicoccus psychrophilus]|uniref:alcohol acetyltransferase n=1 Tax=Jeotgalicoccus psychrophilus TaxID=157228 RepID=UPI0003F7435A|nr:alcohol acetyltransferase [Jeotgalicoccus psychrophilus]
MDQWYKIDNTGKIFHAVSNASNSAVFRVSMTLHETIDPKILQKALDIVVMRFPTLTVRVRKGLFWDFLEQNDQVLQVKKESDYPCAPIDRKENNAFLIRVLYFGKRISVEVFHSLTDGGGAAEFLKTLAYQYVTLKGEPVEADEKIMLPDEAPKREEVEDSFEKYATSREVKNPASSDKKAYQLKGTQLNPPGINVIQGVVDAGALNTYAKAQGTSLTGFLTSLLIKVIHMEKNREKSKASLITVAMPVSLRRHFPSVSIRNFFSVSNIGVRMSDDVLFEDVITEVTKQLIEKTDKSFLQESINRFVAFQSNLLLRIIPVFIKYPVMRFAFNQFGERAKTITVSNLGNIQLPDSMRPYADSMDVVLYPTNKSPINCGTATVNNKLTITFSRSIEENEIIRTFFKEITRLTGLEVKVSSNGWGE